MDIDFNKLKHLLPYIGGLCIVFGYFKLNLFYSHFNINISEYIDFTEMITAFIPDGLLYLGMVSLVISVNFLLESQSERDEKKENFNKLISGETFLKRLKIYLKQNIPYVFIFIVYNTILIISHNNNDLNKSYYFFLANFILFNLIFLEFKLKYFKIYNKWIDNTVHNLFFIILYFTFYIYFWNFENIKDTNKGILKICFSYTENFIQSTDNLIYVGQSKNYIFMYDKLSNESYVYPRGEIKNLSFY